MAQSLRLDPIRCDGYGMCAELLPELIDLDDWGFPIIRPGEVPERLLDHARRAVDVCPVLALKVQATTGHARPAAAGQQRVAAATAPHHPVRS